MLKKNIIKLLSENYNTKEIHYYIYTIIKEHQPECIECNNNEYYIDFNKINKNIIEKINIYIKNLEEKEIYEKKRENELNQLNIQKLSLNDNVKENPNEKYDYTEMHILNNWKKFWKDEYKGKNDNIIETHSKKLLKLGMSNVTYNNINEKLKHKRNVTIKDIYPLNAQGVSTSKIKKLTPKQIKEFYSMKLDDTSSTTTEIISKKERNRLLFGESDTESESEAENEIADEIYAKRDKSDLEVNVCNIKDENIVDEFIYEELEYKESYDDDYEDSYMELDYN